VSFVMAVLCGLLTTLAVFLMLRRNLVRFLFGLIILGNATNLAIFTAGGLGPPRPPFIPPDAETVIGDVANPLPQALILTAIVISFGLVSFALALALRAWRTLGTINVDAMRLAESEDAGSGSHGPA
jgi:multicomponent Na+:H+ antiporter subunit C